LIIIVGWGVGMGEIVKIDSRWRIVIPKKFRDNLKPNDEFIVEKIGDTIVLRKFNREELIKEFNEIKLYTKDEMKNANAERGKELYGGVKE